MAKTHLVKNYFIRITYGSVAIHNRNIQALATEFYKIKNGLLPELFTELFTKLFS